MKIGKKLLSTGVLLGLMGTSVISAPPHNLYKRNAEGKNVVVAAAKPEAAQIGIDIIKAGGNAIDAAVAVGFAIGVYEPNASGIGGGGFMLIRQAKTGKTVVIDYREVAPAKANENFFNLDENGKVKNRETTIGGKASGVPGNVAGLLTALEQYGTMNRKQVMTPAIEAARKGITVTAGLSSIIQDEYEKVSMFPETAKIYLKDGLPYETGDILKNEDYAKTLEKIMKDGRKAFYEGEIAQRIADENVKQGGVMTVEDLKNYKVEIREPVQGTYRGYQIISCPPASSGGTHVVEILNILENFDMSSYGDNTTESLHYIAEAFKLAFADRAEFMGDTAFVDVPLNGLTSKAYAKELAAKIDPKKAAKDVKPGVPNKYEHESTTSFAIMDKEGNMVCVTQTINNFFGSGVTVPGTGMLMNDEMDDFVAQPGTKNSVAPGKRPLSSMSPTLIVDPQGRPFMAVGSPGAKRIISAVTQTIINVIDYGMDIQQAISAPRIHQEHTGDLQLEGRIAIDAYKTLQEMGHNVNVRDSYALYFGGVHAVMMDYDKGILKGGADPRRDGQSVGY